MASTAAVPTGAVLVAGEERYTGRTTFHAVYPATGEPGELAVAESTAEDVVAAAAAAAAAAGPLRWTDGAVRAQLLQRIAAGLEADAAQIVDLAARESGLTEARLSGELVRTCVQLRAFADLVAEGSYVEAIIDPPDPDARPAPRPDLRRMLVARGPVAVFGASNFPLAFSVAGGDTASALAAGCPVVVKGHPAHPGTSELAARAVLAAVTDCGLSAGTFALLPGRDPELSRALVRAPQIKAVGFTGSQPVGRALFDLAAARPEPIPVYAEMGSLNPVFVTTAALAARAEDIAAGFADSVLQGNGQFCTKPGLAIVPEGSAGDAFVASLGERLAAAPAAPLLGENIRAGLAERLARTTALSEVDVVCGRSEDGSGDGAGDGGRAGDRDGAGDAGRDGGGPGIRTSPTLLQVSWTALTARPELLEEHFGPVTIVVRTPVERYGEVAAAIPGSLTATVHGEAVDEPAVAELAALLADRAGRLIWNGYPTGVAVTAAMHHGGPYPAATFPEHTSVGLTAIRRWLRPVAYQNAPHWLLPPALRDGNPLGIRRLVDGSWQP